MTSTSTSGVERIHLRHAAHVALLAAESRAGEGARQLARQLDAHDSRAEAEHVHVVMLDTLVGRVMVMAEPRADAAVLVGGDGGAHAAAADENAALGPPFLDGAGE